MPDERKTTAYAYLGKRCTFYRPLFFFLLFYFFSSSVSCFHYAACHFLLIFSLLRYLLPTLFSSLSINFVPAAFPHSELFLEIVKFRFRDLSLETPVHQGSRTSGDFSMYWTWVNGHSQGGKDIEAQTYFWKFGIFE